MNVKKKVFIIVVIIILLCVLGGVLARNFMLKNNNSEKEQPSQGIEPSAKVLIDDWKYDENEYSNSSGGYGITGNGIISKSVAETNDGFSASDATIGYSVGGSKNIENFRENIKNGYFPISTDITYNGLYYDYYFDKGKSEESNELFSPAYSVAVSRDPISSEYEYYMTVGLNSNIKESDFKRKKLNVIVVMDISGSMSSGFNSYYYDDENNNDEQKSKMKIANESLNLLIDELNEDDRIGIVLFDDESYLAKPVNFVGKSDISKLKEHILEIKARGGTNFEAGYTRGTELFTDEMLNDKNYENRIIVITDAMPNMGKTSKDGLAENIEKNAENGIYTTFIGVGVDFNTEVIECLSDVKGANYYSVHSSEEFKKIMGEDFDYMVTPLVFDLELKLESDLFSIENVYGTDTKKFTSGTIMKVNTLFPSSTTSDGKTKGGVILIKLKPAELGEKLAEKIDKEDLKLSVSYEDRDGNKHSNAQNVKFENVENEYYDNMGIRKAIVLSRYANLMKNWILYERTENRPQYKQKFYITSETGIEDVIYTQEEIYKILGENERRSTKLSVSEEYVELFKKFRNYMKSEIEILGDDDMNQEVEILDLLAE